jgi:hypothetical protein
VINLYASGSKPNKIASDYSLMLETAFFVNWHQVVSRRLSASAYAMVDADNFDS